MADPLAPPGFSYGRYWLFMKPHVFMYHFLRSRGNDQEQTGTSVRTKQEYTGDLFAVQAFLRKK
jgi:hypothetical protein